MSVFIVAIDGPSAVGKGTLSKKIAKEFNFNYLDTGRLYRATAFIYINNYLQESEEILIENAVNSAKSITNELLNKKELYNLKVATYSAILAKIPKVREELIHWQRKFCSHIPKNNNGIILDGRDIGTIIAPNANVKIFLEASLNIRAERRYKEARERGIKCDYENILSQIRVRDQNDINRKESPCIPAKDAVLVNTDLMNAEQAFHFCKKIIKNKYEK